MRGSKRMKRMALAPDLDLAMRAHKDLVRLGILEDSGERRRNPDGVMEVVWQLSPLGRLVGEYGERLNIGVYEALAKVNALGGKGIN
jgi:hypothetical protein